MATFEELFNAGILIHGHRCPAMPVGIKAGLAAIQKLGVSSAKNKELFCIAEVGPTHAMHCFCDGVQFATGCTFGKGNIIKVNYAKLAFTLIDVKTKKAVRVVLNPTFHKKALSSEFLKQRLAGVEPQDISPEIANPMIENAISQPDDVLFKISDVFDIDFTPPKGTFEWVECQKCGEITFGCGVRVKDGKQVCLPCSGYEAAEVKR